MCRSTPWRRMPRLLPLIDAWRALGIDWVMAIERCGLSADGRPRNMRGEDLQPYTAPLDQIFTAGPWRTIAIGDGGNEVGMGCSARRSGRSGGPARRDHRLRDAGGFSGDRGCIALGGVRA